MVEDADDRCACHKTDVRPGDRRAAARRANRYELMADAEVAAEAARLLPQRSAWPDGARRTARPGDAGTSAEDDRTQPTDLGEGGGSRMGDLRDDTYSELEPSWSWRVHAACRTVDSALFFGGDGERQRARRARERRAKAICATCPVLLPCRAYALVRRERHGIWGGLSERDRALVLRDSGPPATAAAGGSPA